MIGIAEQDCTLNTKNPQSRRQSETIPDPLPPSRLYGIQFLRFAAAMMVVVYHADIFTDAIYPRSLSDPLRNFAFIGAAGVPIFFTISGFVMFHTAGRMFGQARASVSFLKRRLLRIYPIYWVCLLLYVLNLMLRDPASIPSATSFLWTALLVPGYAEAIISPAWTLVYEMYFYSVFGLLLMLPKGPAIAVLTLVLAGGVTTGYLVESNSALAEVITRSVLLEFLAGVYLAWIVATPSLARRLTRPAIAWILLVAALTGLALAPLLYRADLPALLYFGLPGALIVAWAVVAENCGHFGPVMLRLARLGDSSYALYLIHILVMSLCMLLLRPLTATVPVPPMMLVLVLSAVSLVAGMVLHAWVERPLLTALRSLSIKTTPTCLAPHSEQSSDAITTRKA